MPVLMEFVGHITSKQARKGHWQNTIAWAWRAKGTLELSVLWSSAALAHSAACYPSSSTIILIKSDLIFSLKEQLIIMSTAAFFFTMKLLYFGSFSSWSCCCCVWWVNVKDFSFYYMYWNTLREAFFLSRCTAICHVRVSLYMTLLFWLLCYVSMVESRFQ